MVRKVLLVISMITILSTSAVFAEEVYVTGNGKKFHKMDCRLIKDQKSLKPYEKDAALKSGYTPCKKCFKEELGLEASNGNKIAEAKKK